MELGERMARAEQRIDDMTAAFQEERREREDTTLRVAAIERARDLEAARVDARAEVAVRAAARATSSERRRFAMVGIVVAVVTAVSPHIHHLP